MVAASRSSLSVLDSGAAVGAVLSIASAAVLVQVAEAPALALAFWRCLGGALVLAPAALRSRELRTALRVSGSALILPGLALGIHFATWLESLERTSTAASVTLVTTAPIFVALGNWSLGRRPANRLLVGIAVALMGSAFITGGDLLANRGSVDGDLLALAGAIAMAVYLLAGDRLRSQLPTAAYAAPVYAIAALATGFAALLGGLPLVGFDGRTWLAIGGMILGPQLGGHTVLNYLLGQIGSTLVSMILLAEPVVASLLTWLFLAEMPPLAAWLGAPVVLVGMAIAVHATSTPISPDL